MSDHAFGSITFSGDDVGYPAVDCDRLAISDNGELLFCSVVAPTQVIKGIRGILCSNKKASISVGHIQVKRASQADHYLHYPRNVWMPKDGDGFSTSTHRLPYGIAHAFFLSRHEGFLIALDEANLWQELSSNAFTTPLLREWTPWITKRLTDDDLLREAKCHNCSCGMYQFTNLQLDAIVSDGLKKGDLKIERAVAA